MKISATIKSKFKHHEIFVTTNESAKEMHISAKHSGFGSSINGGELLLLSLATCFCNDLYREADKMNIKISGVEVEVTGEFGAEGEAGTNFMYKTSVISDSPKSDIEKLIKHTDKVAEIQNTLRKGLDIKLMT